MKEPILLTPNTVWYKKRRNGLWLVFLGEKQMSMHSTEEGAKESSRALINHQS